MYSSCEYLHLDTWMSHGEEREKYKNFGGYSVASIFTVHFESWPSLSLFIPLSAPLAFLGLSN